MHTARVGEQEDEEERQLQREKRKRRKFLRMKQAGVEINYEDVSSVSSEDEY